MPSKEVCLRTTCWARSSRASITAACKSCVTRWHAAVLACLHRAVREAQKNREKSDTGSGGPYHPSCLRSRILEDHVRTLLRDHKRRRIGVAGYEERHDGGVNNAQP